MVEQWADPKKGVDSVENGGCCQSGYFSNWSVVNLSTVTFNYVLVIVFLFPLNVGVSPYCPCFRCTVLVPVYSVYTSCFQNAVVSFCYRLHTSCLHHAGVTSCFRLNMWFILEMCHCSPARIQAVYHVCDRFWAPGNQHSKN